MVQLGLGEYVSKFKNEMIDGHMLFELDDEVMRDELGMSKKLHRLRLLMIIKGTQSVNSHLKD